MQQWKNSKCYTFCVCVCSLRYPACSAHAPYCRLWPAPLYNIFPHYLINGHDKWVPANILSKHSRKADKEWSSSLGFGRGANSSTPFKLAYWRNGYTCLGPGLILWYGLSYGILAWNVVLGIYRSGSRTAAAREFARYEGWNFNSGNYLFTTDTK